MLEPCALQCLLLLMRPALVVLFGVKLVWVLHTREPRLLV